MHKALRLPAAAESADPPPTDDKLMRKVVAENAVVIFARNGCCMCHVVKLLLHGHGVNPRIVHVDDQNEAKLAGELADVIGQEGSGNSSRGNAEFPVVFVGGELFGGLDEIMAAHISGELVPKLREARALWL